MRIKAALLGGLLLSGAASAAQFQNGSFELGSVPTSATSVGLGSTAITGWSVIDNGDPGTNVEWQKNGSYAGVLATEGVYSVDLSGNPDKASNGLRQVFDTLGGHTYALTFDVGLNTNYTSGDGSSVQALVDGLAIGTLANLDRSATQTWTTGTFNFLASGSSTTLDLVKVTGGNYTGLDNVRVVDLTPTVPVVPGSVPEPASWAMMLVGFGLLGGMLRRPSAAAATVIG